MTVDRTGAPSGGRAVPAFFSYGFRLFFFATGFWAAAALALWIVMFTTGAAVPSRFDPLTWHIHEMLFGFVMAAIAGFLLTAIPTWTNRPPISGGPLALLAGLWLLGRIACLVSAFLPLWLAIAADLSFPVVLAGVAAREIVTARNWRNLPMVTPLIVLGIANLLMHLEADGVALPSGLGWRLGLAAVIVLISAVAGRIVPSFTRNWLVKRSGSDLPASHDWIDRAGLGILHTALILWAFLPAFRLIGLLLLLAALLNLWRLLRWRGVATVAEPLLLILHIAYAWLVLGTALLGVVALGAGLPQTAAIHALAVGAIGTMILAVMTRVARGHTGRDLSADRVTVLIYGLVTVAAITRVLAALGAAFGAAFGAAWTLPLLIISAGFWIAAFVGFLFGYGPILFLPRSDR